MRDLEEQDLQSLIGVPEGLTLEFKRELNLSTPEQKREAAKDLSAMANTAGGRILYGVDEGVADDGSKVASGISPVTDGALVSRLTDILCSVIQPRPRFNAQPVAVAGGHVLVVEVDASSGLDLHMVSGAREGRYYRRGPNGNVPMTEPEVREAYVRIAEQRASLHARVDSLMHEELGRRQAADASFLVVPIYSRPNLVDPRHFNRLGDDLYKGVLKDFDLRNMMLGLGIVHDGYRAEEGGGANGPTIPRRYLAILKSGVVHWSTATSEPPFGELQKFWSIQTAREIIETMVVARFVLRSAGYSGDVRLIHRIRRVASWLIDPSRIHSEPVLKGNYGSEVARFDLEATVGSWGSVVKELLDPYFHAAGIVACPYFTPDGAVLARQAAEFPPAFDEYLMVERMSRPSST